MWALDVRLQVVCTDLFNIPNVTGIYLILAEHFTGYSEKNRLRIFKEIGI